MLTRCVDKEEAATGIRAMGLSPGTVATQMQREIKASGINPVSQLDWYDPHPAGLARPGAAVDVLAPRPTTIWATRFRCATRRSAAAVGLI